MLTAAQEVSEPAADAEPGWLYVSGSLATRLESLSERLALGESGGNKGLFTRALLEVSVRGRFAEATVEVIDARVTAERDDTRLTTGQVNTAEFVQAYVAFNAEGAFTENDGLRVLVGRHTQDLGGRRLVARPIYRNTLNSFTGVNATWTAPDGRFGRAFYTLPVERLPRLGDGQRLDIGDVRTDEESADTRFYGGVLGWRDLWAESDLELTWLGLDERDSADSATANRRLQTFDLRFVKAPVASSWHWEFETALQVGTSRRDSASTEDLDHSAYLHHATLGYTFDAPGTPRLEALFDMASGDRSPDDDENNRFDSLYGISRQDFGPTGFFRAISRANIVSPGLRTAIRPVPRMSLTLMQRFNYLASDRDAWSGFNVDPTGQSGSHIGNLTEFIARYDVLKDRSIQLELGAAYHAAGTFAVTAPGADDRGDSLFGYAQLTFWF